MTADSEAPRSAWTRTLIIALATAVVLSVVGSLLIALRLSPRPSAAPATAQEARDACQKASRKLLRTPGSAQWLNASQWSATGDAAGRWTVVLQYRLTGKDGASRSGTADCTIRHEPSTDEWHLLDLVER